ncbi:MAG: AAA family ATPase, partial [Chloroflexi bacterium]|nr:AAA family ATPase [Chloroflexota bacterium]
MSDDPAAPSREPTAEESVEQALLGALLIDNTVLSACGGLTEDHFSNGYHRVLFRALRLMIERNELATMRTVRSYLDQDSPAYLAAIVKEGALPTSESVRGYANAVMTAWRRRGLIEIADGVGYWAKLPSPDRSVNEMVADTQVALDEIAITGPESGPVMTGAAFEEGLDEVDRRFQSGNELLGLSTGLRELDDTLGGLAPGNLINIAGRPGMGKTGFATSTGVHVAKALGIPSLFFSLEMTTRQVAYRILASLTGLRYHDIGRARISLDEFGSMRAAAAAHKDMPLLIDPTPALTVSAIRSRVRSLMRHTPVGLVIIDHLGKIRRPEMGSDVVALGHVTSSLAAMAKEFDLPVLLLCQLNRSVDYRDD